MRCRLARRNAPAPGVVRWELTQLAIDNPQDDTQNSPVVYLPLANLLHHKLRSALSALGVGIGVCMLITLSGLSRGSLEEVADRWEAVDADLIVYAARWGDNITTISGGGLGNADADLLRALTVAGKNCVERVVPIFLYRISVAGDEHNVVGVAPADLPSVLGGSAIAEPGRRFDPDNAFARWLEGRLTARPVEGEAQQTLEITADQLAEHGGLEIIVDTRLAKAAGKGLGQSLYTAGHHFTVVGVVPEGALARAFMPLATAQWLFAGRMGRHTLMFVKLRPGVRVGAAVEAIGATRHLAAVAVDEYRGMLEERFGIMYLYVDTVNVVTLIVAFLFILVTLYTMVIQRRREIAILRSMGASRRYVLREVVAESMILSACGTVAGVAMSFAAAAGIEALKPLLTVTITWDWLAIAAGAAGLGAAVAAVYPAFCAMRVDVVEALSLE